MQRLAGEGSKGVLELVFQIALLVESSIYCYARGKTYKTRSSAT